MIVVMTAGSRADLNALGLCKPGVADARILDLPPKRESRPIGTRSASDWIGVLELS
jgi:hypothetical protein